MQIETAVRTVRMFGGRKFEFVNKATFLPTKSLLSISNI